MPRIKYYYDTDKCHFEKATFTWKTALRKGFSYLMVGGVLAVMMVSYLYHFHKDRNTQMLESENEALMAEITNFDDRIAQMETELTDLHETDKEVYSTIMNASPISEDVWNAGTGGSIVMDDYEDETLKDTRQRLEKMKSQLEIQKKSYENAIRMAHEKRKELEHMPSIRPVRGSVISGFGKRLHPILKVRKMHTGLDFQAPTGTKIYASADGIIKHAGRSSGGYGIHIDIDHGYGYTSKYAHLSKLLVREGQRVTRGEVIGLTGNTGLSKGPHLHYEILKDGNKIDPIDYFYSDLDPETYMEFKRQASQFNESMD